MLLFATRTKRPIIFNSVFVGLYCLAPKSDDKIRSIPIPIANIKKIGATRPSKLLLGEVEEVSGRNSCFFGKIGRGLAQNVPPGGCGAIILCTEKCIPISGF